MDISNENKLRKAIIKACEGSRHGTDFFNSLSDDAYIGYQTAMIVNNTYNINASVKEKYCMIKIMFEKGEI
jgi:hypothetical protein